MPNNVRGNNSRLWVGNNPPHRGEGSYPGPLFAVVIGCWLVFSPNAEGVCADGSVPTVSAFMIEPSSASQTQNLCVAAVGSATATQVLGDAAYHRNVEVLATTP